MRLGIALKGACVYRWTIMATLLFLLLAAACSGGQQAGDAETIIGECQPGTTLSAGEGCTIAHTDANDTFWVDEDTSGCYSVRTGGTIHTSTTRCAYPAISEDAITVSLNNDRSWTVVSVP